MQSTTIKRCGTAVVLLAVAVALAGCTPAGVIRSIASGAANATAGGSSDGRYAPLGPDGLPDDGYIYGDEDSDDAGYSESGFEPTETEGPVAWTALASCDDGSDVVPWVLIDTFPTEQIDASEIYPFCADSFVVDDGESFTDAVATVSAQQVYLLGGKLTSAGYTLVSDDFDPQPYEGSGGYAGAREYTLGDTSLLISAYDNGVRPVSLTVFLDYFSPETRAFSNSQS
jgi:hypothetical protein